MANEIKIGGRLHSVASGNVVAGANEIIDDQKGKKQSQINQEVDEALATIPQTASAEIPSGDTPGTPTANAVLENGNIHITLEHVKGDKGDPLTWEDLTEQQKESLKGEKGDSAVFNPDDPDTPVFEMANGLGVSTVKSMTQKAVSDEFIAVKKDLSKEIIDYSYKSYSIIPHDKTNGNKFAGNSSNKHGYIPVTEGEKYIYEGVMNGAYAFATSDTSSSGANVPLVSGYDVEGVPNGELVIITIPSGCSYLLFNSINTSVLNRIYKYNDKLVIGNVLEPNSQHSVSSKAVYNALLRETNYVPGKLINSSGEIVDTEDGHFISTPIPVNYNDVIYWKFAIDSETFAGMVNIYDSNMNRLTTYRGANSSGGQRTKTINEEEAEDAAFAIISFSGESGYTPQVTVNSTVVWENKIEDGRVSAIDKKIEKFEAVTVVKVKSHEASTVISEMTRYSSNSRMRTSNKRGDLKVTEGLKATLEYKEEYASGWNVALRFVDDDAELVMDTLYKTGKLEVIVPKGATKVDLYIKKTSNAEITEEEQTELANAFKTFQIPYRENEVGGVVPSMEYMEQKIAESKGESITQSTVLRAIKSIAHQGYGGSKDTATGHNLAESYVNAAKEGFDWGETDIQFSSDEVPMCSHDDHFIANGTRIDIAEYTAEELKEYAYFGKTISTLDEVMAACKSSGMGLQLDKTDSAYTSNERLQKVLDIIRKYQMMERVMWLMYDNGNMDLASKITTWYPKSKIARMVNISGTAFVDWTGDNKAGIIQQIISWANTYTQAEVYLALNYNSETPETLQAAAALFPASVKLAIFTVNDKNRYQQLMPYVDAITSDFYAEFEDFTESEESEEPEEPEE